ncbi:MAG: hypothetical protein AABZ67_14080 [Pseudomonadota bacterium]
MRASAFYPQPALGATFRQWLHDGAPLLRTALHAAGNGLLKITKARILLEPGTRRASRRL